MWKIVGGIAGIGGIALAAVVYIFREIIRAQKVFTPVTRRHTYELLNRIITYTFIIGVLGIGAYLTISLYNGGVNSRPVEPTPSPTPGTSNSASNAQRPSPSSPDSGNTVKTQTPISNQTASNANGAINNTEAPAPTPVTFLLSSRVFDEDSNPLRGAKVSLVDLPQRSAETSSNGTFILEGIPAKLNERVKILIESSGYKSEEREVVIGRPLPMFYLKKVK